MSEQTERGFKGSSRFSPVRNKEEAEVEDQFLKCSEAPRKFKKWMGSLHMKTEGGPASPEKPPP